MPPTSETPRARSVSLHDFNLLRDLVTGMDARLTEMRDSIHKVQEALTGNGFGANHGLIERVKTLENTLTIHIAEFHAFRDEQRQAWARVKWTASGIGIGAGLGGGSLVYAAVKLIGG